MILDLRDKDLDKTVYKYGFGYLLGGLIKREPAVIINNKFFDKIILKGMCHYGNDFSSSFIISSLVKDISFGEEDDLNLIMKI